MTSSKWWHVWDHEVLSPIVLDGWTTRHTHENAYEIIHSHVLVRLSLSIVHRMDLCYKLRSCLYLCTLYELLYVWRTSYRSMGRYGGCVIWYHWDWVYEMYWFNLDQNTSVELSWNSMEARWKSKVGEEWGCNASLGEDLDVGLVDEFIQTPQERVHRHPHHSSRLLDGAQSSWAVLSPSTYDSFLVFDM